mmetsp:Transcript_23430/g.65592  ORF Transcript_23430/g.65592 Transcript_23430/m.65592 type:complete len:261 (+) Transcript_23430:48-830(+)
MLVAHLGLLAENEAALAAYTGAHSTQVLFRSLLMVSIAELFDKTWFMGLLLAMKYNPAIVFLGSFVALFLHCIFAAAFGYAFARFLSPVLLNFLATGLFAVFAVLYTKDFMQADPNGDVIQSGKDEVEQDMGPAEGETLVKENANALPLQAALQRRWKEYLWVFLKSFVAVFIAEWGDRTQIAMIGQHASQPLIPVFLGSVVAFFLLTFSAVGAARVLKDLKMSERFVYGVSAIAFAVFAALSLKDGCLMAHRRHMQTLA